jgi:DNA repair protein RadC
MFRGKRSPTNILFRFLPWKCPFSFGVRTPSTDDFHGRKDFLPVDEHLNLLVGKKSVALALIRHFGSLKGLARASFQELRQFLPRRQAESVVAALSMFVIAETEHARSERLDNPESIYRACADMKLFNQEVLRVILLDTRYRHISIVEITKGSIDESLAHPRDIFRPVIGQTAFAFELGSHRCVG